MIGEKNNFKVIILEFYSAEILLEFFFDLKKYPPQYLRLLLLTLKQFFII